MTTKAWLLRELGKDIDAAKDAAPVGFGATEPWSMRLHMLRRCVQLVESGARLKPVWGGVVEGRVV